MTVLSYRTFLSSVMLKVNQIKFHREVSGQHCQDSSMKLLMNEGWELVSEEHFDHGEHRVFCVVLQQFALLLLSV